MIGIQRSADTSASSPLNPAAATPVIVNVRSFKSSVLPATAGSDANRRCQNAWLTTATK